MSWVWRSKSGMAIGYDADSQKECSSWVQNKQTYQFPHTVFCADLLIHGKENGFIVYKTSPWLYPDPGLTNVNHN
jgi:hypothetical protein